MQCPLVERRSRSVVREWKRFDSTNLGKLSSRRIQDPMNQRASVHLAFLSLLGSLSAAGCGSEHASQGANSPTPNPDQAPAVPDDSSTPLGTPPQTSEGVITAAGLIRPVAATENSGAACDVTVGVMSKHDALPDPFAKHDGTVISAKTDWECRRNEIRKDIEQYEIGAKPDPSTSTVAASYDGTSLNVVITSAAGSMSIMPTRSLPYA